MNKIFEQAKDLHARKVVTFANATDSKLYADAAFTVQLKEEELQELFAKGMLLVNVDEDAFAEAVLVSAEKAYIPVVGESAVTLVAYSAKAAE